MTVERFATTPNQGITTLNGALSDSATTIPVNSMADLKLTGLTGTDFAYCKITKQENWRQHPINRKEAFEIIKVTAVSGDNLTAVRGQDTTSGTTFADGDIVEVVFVSINYQHLVDALTDGTKELLIGTLTVANGLTVTAGGALITAGGVTVTAGGVTATTGNFVATAGGFQATSGDSAFGRGVLAGIKVAIQEANTQITDMFRLIQASTGDCAMAWVLSDGSDWMAGIDNSDGDKWKLAPALALTVNTIISADPTTQEVEFPSGDIKHSGGDLYWVGAGSGLDFAGISVKDNASATTLNSAAKVQYLHFGTNDSSNSAVADHANDHITITRAGVYVVICFITVENSAGASHKIDASVWKNNGATELENVHAHRDLAAGTDVASVGFGGLVTLAAADTLELWLDTDRGVDSDVIGEDCSMFAIQIGGT